MLSARDVLESVLNGRQLPLFYVYVRVGTVECVLELDSEPYWDEAIKHAQIGDIVATLRNDGNKHAIAFKCTSEVLNHLSSKSCMIKRGSQT